MARRGGVHDDDCAARSEAVRPDARVVAQLIEEALHRHAIDEAHGIAVTVFGNRVSLGGTVRSWTHRRLAAHSVWRIRGVYTVIDTMRVADPERHP